MESMPCQGIQVSEAKVGVRTNSPSLLDPAKFFWMDTNFLSITRIPCEEGMDSFFEIKDGDFPPSFHLKEKTLKVSGPFSSWEEGAKDKRYSIFGNLGLFSSWVLRTLEQSHDIGTFHACGLTKGEKLLIIPGGAGAGKSVFIFKALDQGWKLLATEFVHFQVKGDVFVLKGAFKDAVRVETLRFHFPEWTQKLNLPMEEEVGGKLVVNLSGYQDERERIENPEIVLVFPHVEEEWERFWMEELKSQEELLRRLFHNASEKVGKSQILYGRMPVPGLDTSFLAQKRWNRLQRLYESGRLSQSFQSTTGIQDIPRIFHKL